MKKIVRFLSAVLAMLMIGGALSACQSAGLRLAKKGDTEYTIVYHSKSETGKNAAQTLATKLEEKLGTTFACKDDRTEPVGKEILIGVTTRDDSKNVGKSVRARDWAIAREGENLVIFSWEDAQLAGAVNYFLENLIDEKGNVQGKGILYVNEKNYAVTSMTLFDRPITDYTIAYNALDASTKTYAEQLEKAFLQKSGFRILTEGFYEKVGSDGPYIILNGKDESIKYDEYKILRDGENLVISAGSEIVAMSVFQQFVHALLPSGIKGDVVLNVSFTEGATKFDQDKALYTEGTDIRLMTFNVPNTIGGEMNLPKVDQRMKYVNATILTYMPHFVCLQEWGSGRNISDLRNAGYAYACATLPSVGPKEKAEGVEISKHGASLHNNTPILYRTDLYEVVEWDAFLYYYNDRYTPTNTKSLSWCVFRNKADGSLVLVMGTHMAIVVSNYNSEPGYETVNNNVEGVKWRSGNVDEILMIYDMLREKYPGILTLVAGDMNARWSNSKEESLRKLDAHATLSDAFKIAPADKRQDGGTYHGLTTNKLSTKTDERIDHIFVSDDRATVLFHDVIDDENGMLASDHCAVIVDIAKK